MRGFSPVCLAIGLGVFSAGLACAETDAPVQGWPRLFESAGAKVIVHQPQLDDWRGYSELIGKAAIAVVLEGESREYYGAMDLQAATEVDFDSRTVLLKQLKVGDLTFPNIEEGLAERCRRTVMSVLPVGSSLTISMDRILAGLERTKARTEAITVSLAPPPIYYSDSPAVLLMFMGEPKFESVPGVTDLLFAVNTNWDLLLEVGTSDYYLLHGRSWLVTKDLVNGPWRAAASLPKAFGKLPSDENWKAVKENIPGSRAAVIPKILVSTRPAELILTDGVAKYSPVMGTKLLYVSNTDSDAFLHSGTGRIYFLAAGRWFESKTLSGPWAAASENLPEDFSRIPVDHAKAHVLSSVPGTPEADAAVLLASVPRKATVNRENTTVTVVYEGDPEFVEINDTTSKVYYAVNTPYSVFRVDTKYYAAHNGVWFVSSAAGGPWAVCTSVPRVLYSIPATHPKHNVTYVYIYDSTPDTVVVGYTSGYSGTYVATTGVVMFGLGYWIAHDHYHHYHYHSHYYAYGSAAHYDYYHGGFYHSARHYGPHGGAGGWAGYDPASGTYYRGGFAAGPYGSAFARQAYNPYTGRYASQAGAKTPYGSWGRTVVTDGNDWARAGHRSQMGKTIGGIETSRGGKAVGGYNKWTGRGAVVGKDKYGDVYVGRDGNVYKKNGENWQRNDGKRWDNVEPSAARNTVQSRSEAVRGQAATSQRKLPGSVPSRVTGGGSRLPSRAPTSQRRSPSLNRDYQRRSVGNARAGTFQRRAGSSGGGARSIRRR